MFLFLPLQCQFPDREEEEDPSPLSEMGSGTLHHLVLKVMTLFLFFKFKS